MKGFMEKIDEFDKKVVTYYSEIEHKENMLFDANEALIKQKE